MNEGPVELGLFIYRANLRNDELKEITIAFLPNRVLQNGMVKFEFLLESLIGIR